jgi:phosphoglycerate dehydrogenase-like enzyme/ribulose-5-phosphate 4-epimerase/fuculose-1-phosphate aldolase
VKNILIIDSPQKPYLADLSIERIATGDFAELRCARGVESVPGEWFREADVVVVYHGNSLNRDRIELLARCRGIVAATAGFDHIDVAAAAERSIPVCNIPDYGAEDVADHAILLLLACARQLPAMVASTDRGEWDWHSALAARRLRGQTLGIIGLGRTGRATAERALAFGIDVRFFDPFVSDSGHPQIRKIQTLPELLEDSDFVSIHCPLNRDTARLLGREALRCLRPGAIVVNTARGGIIDQEALIELLDQGRISAAGLDVAVGEPDVPEALRRHDRVILTPHAAFYSQEGLRRMRNLAITAGRNFLEGKGAENSIVRLGNGEELPPKAWPRPAFRPDPAITAAVLRYATFISRRNLVCNTFGGIAIRAVDPASSREVVYTKHMGVSLEEMTEENVVVLDLETDDLVMGTVRPSIGHQMNREIFRLRSDVGAVIHLHPDEVIAYFSVLHEEGAKYISNDTALVMQAPIRVLSPDLNIELDLAPLREIIADSNCIVMPQHGITTLGASLSEAYHRACSLIAETRRLMLARMLASSTGRPIPYVGESLVEHMFEIGKETIYGRMWPGT